jgi:ABC-type bacteriocin/lantibiotic exporter with double-glycine peptidase domain
MLGSNLQKLFGAIPHIVSGNQSLCALHSFCSLHVAPPYSGTTRFKFSGDIELCSVSFRYKSKDVFRGLSIKLNSGSFTAIMGPNGGGKTTIARLILGLYRPDEGVLRADGISYEKLDIERLRQSMAFAPQDPVLFTGTIWDNVSYGIPEEDAVHVKRACEIALVDDFVRYLPGGYNTEVGEDGGSLSGGQRQRIAIARALARCPRLLILDEPTNHLDPFTAQQLFRNLKSMLGACTALIITQDPAVARQAEFLYRLENGNLQRLEGASRFDNERFPEVVEREVIW